jgi:hypothetical protein
MSACLIYTVWFTSSPALGGVSKLSFAITTLQTYVYQYPFTLDHGSMFIHFCQVEIICVCFVPHLPQK